MTSWLRLLLPAAAAEDDAGIAGRLDGRAFGAAVAAAAERGVDGHDVDAAVLHHRGILKGLDDGGRGKVSPSLEAFSAMILAW